jgi:restriction enzyme bgcI subunit beta
MYKYSLNDVEWGEFKVGGKDGIFKVSNSKPYHKANLTVSSNGIPYVTRTSMNNGLEDLIVDENYEKNPKNTISLGAENADFFFQGIDYISGNKMYSISNNKITREVGLFLVQVFRQSIKECGFGYGKGLTGTRFKNRYVMLPVDEKNNPNWHFMEEYIKEREIKQRNDLKEYYKSRLLDLVICPEVLTDVEWGEFSLRDLFTFERGNQNNMSACEVGEIPLISAKKIDNGVKAFISDNGKKLFEGHILTLNNDGDGGVGIAYYQANKMALDTHVTALIPVIPINRSSLLFISKTITIQRDKFSHGYSLNNNRMKAQKIVLPIDENGDPNWSYMENFIKNIEQKQIKNVLKYLDEYIYNV